jgi:hypothetical protein
MPDLYWHSYDDATTTGWKTYPVRVRGPRPSSCCGEATLLVQSMGRGFVTANCSKCGTQDTLSKAEFENLGLWVGCPACKHPMRPEVISDAGGRAGNYGYLCDGCGCCIKLAWILPHWSDVGPDASLLELRS